MYPPLLTICLWHILSNYRLGVVSAPLEVLGMARSWSAAPPRFLKWTTFFKTSELFGIFILGTFRWGHFLPPFLDLLFTCIDTIEDPIYIQTLGYDTYFKPFFSFVVPLPHRWHYTLRRKEYISYFQTKPKERKETNVSTQISPTPITPVSNLAIPNLSLSLKNI